MKAPTLRICIVALTLTTVACGDPVGVKKLTARDQYRQLQGNALTTDTPSLAAEIVLRRHNLVDTYADQPELALETLRAATFSYGPNNGDDLFALAELSHQYSEDNGSRPYALASALYAYAFLFPDDPALRPKAIDARYRWAADIYAAGLMQALAAPDGKTLDLKGGTYPLPFGTAVVHFDAHATEWSGRTLTDFVPTERFDIYGLNNRYRQPGIGVPLAAKPIVTETAGGDEFVAKQIRVPATAVLLIDDPRQQVAGDTVNGNLNLYPVDERDTIEIDGMPVPLEIDRSASLAVSLAEVGFWRQELSNFLGNAIGTRRPARLFAREPYRPGRIPMVFVHGTNSSAARWADMVNDLENDPRIRTRYQFWFFSYDSGNPIPYSAMLLRQALTETVKKIDPDGTDACLHQMVVVGHSQGGLLTKMTVVDSGSAFWKEFSDTPFEEVTLSESSRAIVQQSMFVKPLPFVTRVIFISTPHRGSYLTSWSLVPRLAARLISMPRDLVTLSTDLVANPANRAMKMERLPTALDNMSPGQPFIKTLSGLPIDPNVTAHSIIPVLGDGPLEDEVDGVVAYKSAHIEGVESEVVIHHSGHSTQSDPRTVDEVRRILLEHVTKANCGQRPLRVTSPLQPGSTKPGVGGPPR